MACIVAEIGRLKITEASKGETSSLFILVDDVLLLMIGMENSTTQLTESTNNTFKAFDKKEYDIDTMMITSTLIAVIGIVANLVIDIVFLNQKKMRRKIPNIFIINQVGYFIFSIITIFIHHFNLLNLS